MPSSGYTAISFIANEQPTTAKWNLIGSNDSAFNLGTGLEDNVILTRHILNANITSPKLKPTDGFVVSTGGSQVITTTETDITGATVTLTPAVASIMVIWAFISGLANGNVIQGVINVDGTNQTPQLKGQNPAANNVVFPGFLMNRLTLSAAAHTVKLRASASAGSVTINAFGANETGFYYMLLSQ